MTDLSHNFVIPVGGGIIQRDGTTSIKTKVQLQTFGVNSGSFMN